MIAIVDPGKPTPWWWAKAMPPLWQYFSRLQRKKADEPIPAPKGRGSWTPKPFPLQIESFLGTATGAIIAILDPSQADAVIVGEGDAPVVAVLLAAAKKKADVRMAVPKGRGR